MPKRPREDDDNEDEQISIIEETHPVSEKKVNDDVTQQSAQNSAGEKDTQTDTQLQTQVANEEVETESEPPKPKHKNKPKKNTVKDTTITCTLPPCVSESFPTFSQYELHYISTHTNICSECKSNFPTTKLLDVHIAENHDPFMKIKLQRGDPVFGCFVEGCDRVFSTHKKRRLHLIDKHHYPKDFVFSVVDRGIKKGDTSLIKKNTNPHGVWKPA